MFGTTIAQDELLTLINELRDAVTDITLEDEVFELEGVFADVKRAFKRYCELSTPFRRREEDKRRRRVARMQAKKDAHPQSEVRGESVGKTTTREIELEDEVFIVPSSREIDLEQKVAQQELQLEEQKQEIEVLKEEVNDKEEVIEALKSRIAQFPLLASSKVQELLQTLTQTLTRGIEEEVGDDLPPNANELEDVVVNEKPLTELLAQKVSQLMSSSSDEELIEDFHVLGAYKHVFCSPDLNNLTSKQVKRLREHLQRGNNNAESILKSSTSR